MWKAEYHLAKKHCASLHASSLDLTVLKPDPFSTNSKKDNWVFVGEHQYQGQPDSYQKRYRDIDAMRYIYALTGDDANLALALLDFFGLNALRLDNFNPQDSNF